jgi:hypothetical protein
MSRIKLSSMRGSTRSSKAHDVDQDHPLRMSRQDGDEPDDLRTWIGGCT